MEVSLSFILIPAEGKKLPQSNYSNIFIDFSTSFLEMPLHFALKWQ
ncbi:hypothetical protein Leryth_013985 [Lithospermum erythrorhizon]|nr:hypothetical protein Leryth_013985 [Lithospermum erythrorhizon]